MLDQTTWVRVRIQRRNEKLIHVCLLQRKVIGAELSPLSCILWETFLSAWVPVPSASFWEATLEYIDVVSYFVKEYKVPISVETSDYLSCWGFCLFGWVFWAGLLKKN